MNLKTTREQIVEAADTMFYQRGYEHTSFADIAGVVKISRGNFYHHFKSKDEILDAVIGERIFYTKKILDEWEAASDNPRDRIRSFIYILVRNQGLIMQYGCPVGTLCLELAKLNHASFGKASGLFTLFRNWLSKQFSLLGNADKADQRALHLLARTQGVATLANAFHDEKFIEREIEEMCDWLISCENQVVRQF